MLPFSCYCFTHHICSFLQISYYLFYILVFLNKLAHTDADILLLYFVCDTCNDSLLTQANTSHMIYHPRPFIHYFRALITLASDLV